MNGQRLSHFKQTKIVYRDYCTTPYIGLKWVGINHYAVFISVEGCEILSEVL